MKTPRELYLGDGVRGKVVLRLRGRLKCYAFSVGGVTTISIKNIALGLKNS